MFLSETVQEENSPHFGSDQTLGRDGQDHELQEVQFDRRGTAALVRLRTR
jgi:hypothetical protein